MPRERTHETAAPAIRPVKMPELHCGECMYHIPHATKPNGWCANDLPELRWLPVDPKLPACGAATAWPTGSPVPAFLEAMKF